MPGGAGRRAEVGTWAEYAQSPKVTLTILFAAKLTNTQILTLTDNFTNIDLLLPVPPAGGGH